MSKELISEEKRTNYSPYCRCEEYCDGDNHNDDNNNHKENTNQHRTNLNKIHLHPSSKKTNGKMIDAILPDIDNHHHNYHKAYSHFGYSNNTNNVSIRMTILLLLLVLCMNQASSSSLLTSSPHLIPCNNDTECEQYIRIRSVCLSTGYCSNPFHDGGCLSNYYTANNRTFGSEKFWNRTNAYKTRVCTSSDTLDSIRNGHCVPDIDWNYTEIRLLGNNWESIFFETWIVQILLTEVLGVPTSVDTGYFDKVIDFYDINNRFDYGKGFDWDGLKEANEIEDCRLLRQERNISNEDDNGYISCAHVSLEVWEGQALAMTQLFQQDVIEKTSAMGVLGDGGWFIPKFTAKKHPSLLSYLGLQDNRHQLAELFLRPTKWIDYCQQVSPSNCSIPDDVATRPPNATEEEIRYYYPDAYTGYFRKTIENDCTLYPNNCTGHIADYPCGWSSFVQQQTYWLNISLQSSGDQPYCRGYTYQQLKDIWYAANATRSHVMMLWWTPEALVQTFAGTDSEFQKVHLPLPTQECFNNRILSNNRCQDNTTLTIGNALGACDDQPQALQKAIIKRLYDISYRNPQVALRSPAYDAIQGFQISGLQLNDIFRKWLQEKNHYGYNVQPRDAVCSWIIENYDIFESYIPRTYPRAMQNGEENIYKQPLFYTSLIISIIVLIFVMTVTAATYALRTKRKIIKIAQIEFLILLLCGLVLIQLGSFVMALPRPTDATCIISVWCINIGYTLELVPLIVKITALNQLLAMSQITALSTPSHQQDSEQLARKQRVRIHRNHLFAMVTLCTFMMISYLAIWTIMDPQQEANQYILTDNVNSNDETIVEVYSFCKSSQYSFWIPIAIGWRSLLLIWAIVLAFQTRNCPVNFNESKPLAIMIYAQFIFLVWTLTLYFLMVQNDGGPGGNGSIMTVAQIGRIQSLIYSFDVLSVCCIYFIPKLVTTDQVFDRRCGNGNVPKQRKKHSTMFSTTATNTYYSETFRKGRSTSFVANTEPSASMHFDVLRKRESDFHADSLVFAHDDTGHHQNHGVILNSGGGCNDSTVNDKPSSDHPIDNTSRSADMEPFQSTSGSSSRHSPLTSSSPSGTHGTEMGETKMTYRNRGSLKRFSTAMARNLQSKLMSFRESSKEEFSSDSLKFNDSTSTFVFGLDNLTLNTINAHLDVQQRNEENHRHDNTVLIIEEETEYEYDKCHDLMSKSVSSTELQPLAVPSSTAPSIRKFTLLNDSVVCSVQYIDEDGEMDEVIVEGCRTRKHEKKGQKKTDDAHSIKSSNRIANDFDHDTNVVSVGNTSLSECIGNSVNAVIAKFNDSNLSEDEQQQKVEARVPSPVPPPQNAPQNKNKSSKRSDVGVDFNMLFNHGGFDCLFKKSLQELTLDDISYGCDDDDDDDDDDDHYNPIVATDLPNCSDINTSQRQQYYHEEKQFRNENKIISTVLAERSSFMSDHSDLTLSEELDQHHSIDDRIHESDHYTATSWSKNKLTTNPSDIIKRLVKKQTR